LPHPHHNPHSRFDQLASGLQPPIEYFHALFRALQSLFRPIHALIELGMHLIAPFDTGAKQRLDPFESFTYFAFHMVAVYQSRAIG
jgi:hypothetical protein